MRKITRLSPAVLVGVVCLLAARPGWTKPLQYNGGPFLESFTIYPLYYGAWTQAEINTTQEYVTNLAAYMSGQNAPAGQQPMMKQYGVDQVSVAAGKTASRRAKPVVLTPTAALAIVTANQKNGNFPAFAPGRLLVVFAAHGFSVNDCDGCGSYHSSQSSSGFWAVIPADQEQVVIAHEIFEASADPAVDTFRGWDEAVDQCDNASAITLSFGQIPPATDNTMGGVCSTSGYTSLGEYQLYSSSLSQLQSTESEISPKGWRFYSLQSYVLSNDDVQYTAVWRPGGNSNEKRYYGITYASFISTYNTIYPRNWRLYQLQAFVLTDGEVRYNVVFRPGSTGEHQIYGATFAQFKSFYDTLFPQQWRLVILQSYVVSGEVLYNAVFRPSDVSGEIQLYGSTYENYRTSYDTLYPEGWRLYILDSYVASDGTVLYNAVWRPATHPEMQVYGYTYADYRTLYDTLFNEGWRLYILNVYVLPGDAVRYDAVWRQGTIDRPL